VVVIVVADRLPVPLRTDPEAVMGRPAIPTLVLLVWSKLLLLHGFLLLLLLGFPLHDFIHVLEKIKLDIREFVFVVVHDFSLG
jgi:hypothetical protein